MVFLELDAGSNHTPVPIAVAVNVDPEGTNEPAACRVVAALVLAVAVDGDNPGWNGPVAARGSRRVETERPTDR